MDKSPLPETPSPERRRRNRAQIAAWLETQRGRPQYRPAPAAARSVAKVVKPLAKKFKSGSSAETLIPHWPKIVGERWAKFSRPEKFAGGKEGRLLVISAPGSAAAIITASSGPIIDRVNLFLGEGAVSDIRVIQRQIRRSVPKPTGRTQGLSPRQEDRLQSGLAKMHESELKAALEKLGRGVLSRGT